MDRQVEWFCHHITAEGLVTAEQCRTLAKAFADAGQEPDLEAFAQAVFDNGLCTDNERLEKLGTLAMEEAGTLGEPPEDILGASGAGKPKLALKKAVVHQQVVPAVAPGRTPEPLGRSAESPKPLAGNTTASSPTDDFVPPGSGFLVAGWILFALWALLVFLPSDAASGACGIIVFASWVMVFIDNRLLGFGRMYREAKQWDVGLPLGWFSQQIATYPTLACVLCWVPFFPIYLARRSHIVRVLHETVAAGRKRGVKRKPPSFGAETWAVVWGGVKIFAGLVLVMVVMVVIGVIAGLKGEAVSPSAIRKDRSDDCARNLLRIHLAKQLWASDADKTSGAVDPDGLKRHLDGDDLASLKCPSDGRYSLNDVGVPPACSIQEHTQAFVARDQEINCMFALSRIDKAKAAWASAKGKGPGDVGTKADLMPFVEAGEDDMKCPCGGKYTANPVGTLAQCSFEAHTQAYRASVERESEGSAETEPAQTARSDSGGGTKAKSGGWLSRLLPSEENRRRRAEEEALKALEVQYMQDARAATQAMVDIAHQLDAGISLIDLGSAISAAAPVVGGFVTKYSASHEGKPLYQAIDSAWKHLQGFRDDSAKVIEHTSRDDFISQRKWEKFRDDDLKGFAEGLRTAILVVSQAH